jgi:TonB family protein
MWTRSVRTAAVTLICTFVCLVDVGTQVGAYKVVVNPVNPTTSLSKAQLASIFLRKTATWETGEIVLPVDQVETSALRETFSRDILSMSPTAAAQAAGTPSVATDREVLAYVRLKPGAIGYVSASIPAEGVKVVNVGGRAGPSVGGPQEPIRVGGSVPAPAKLVNVAPVYPPVLRAARVEGTVELEVLISPVGSVEEALVLKPIPGLSEAAVAAVRQWKFASTIINGVAVPVRMTVKVVFALHS